MKLTNIKEAHQKVSHGHEPIWPDKKESTIAEALNWYSYFSDLKEAKKWTIQHLTNIKYNKVKIQHIKELPDWHFITIGYVCRMYNRGAPLTPKNIMYMNTRIEELSSKMAPPIEESTPVAPAISIQERVEKISRDFISELEYIIDECVTSGKFNFNPYDWMVKSAVKPNHARYIQTFYNTKLPEILEALDGKDEQLVEGYSFMTPTQLKKFCGLIKSIVDDSIRLIHNGKASRTPRKKRTVSAEKRVSKIKYKKEDNEYKITSINPIEILGAKQLWVFNTKNRKLGMYNSDYGLSIKGSTLLDYDVGSIQKTLRKPNVIIPTVVSGGKVSLRKIMDDINSVGTNLTGRLNSDTILLRVIK